MPAQNDLNKSVPVHQVRLPKGDMMERTCPGGEFGETEEDVGLVTAKCPSCSQYFVYYFKKNLWMPEEEFEKELQNHPPNVV